VYGFEIDDDSILQCVRRGLSVIQADLESGLRMFPDRMFDTVVLSQTLQAMHKTEAVLREMARVGRQGIVSFPNFGHWRHLLALLAGRMPVSPQMPYQWYDTPNVHLCTPRDFEILAARLGLVITGRALLANGRPVNVLPSLRSKLAVYRFEPK
jgi:methionine biosynthesis protein MetW